MPTIGEIYRDDYVKRHMAPLEARIAELEAVVSCFLVSYEASFGNVSDALGRRAAALVPDWRERADKFDPTKP